jgi:hypothetical protein
MSVGTDWGHWDGCLGIIPDKKLSAAIGCSEDSVINRRRKLGIRPYTQNFIDWAAWDGRLGKETDVRLARRIGCAEATVRKRRKELGIGSFRDAHGGGKPRRIDWARWDGILGTMPDEETAKTIGCSVRPVEKRRAKLRVPAFSRHARLDWSEWAGELGRATDRETAEAIGCSLVAVEQRRARLGVKPCTKNDRIDWRRWDACLGKSCDSAASGLIGCSVSSVRRRRKALGIPAFDGRRSETPKKVTPASFLRGERHCVI